MADGKEKCSAIKGEADQVLGKRQNVGRRRSAHILCQPCSKKEKRKAAVVFCSTCDELQCMECSQIHQVYAFMKTHQLVDVKEAEFKPKSVNMEGLDQCVKHQKALEFFCVDEKMLCCSTCAIVDHRRCHGVVEIQTIANKLHTTGSALKAKLQEEKAKTDLVIQHTTSSREQLNKDIKRILLTIKQMRHDMKKMFGDLVISATKSSETFVTETIDKITTKQSVCEQLLADVTNVIAIIDNVCQYGTPTQQFIIERRMRTQLSDLQHRTKQLLCQGIENPTVSFGFFNDIDLPPKPISDYMPGMLVLKYSMPSPIKNIALEDPIMKLEKIASIDLKQAGDDAMEPFYAGLDFLPDGRLFAVDNNNKICLIFNEKLEKVGSYQLLYHPKDVVAVSEEEVAITSGDQYIIDFLRVSKSNKMTLTRTCKVKTKYCSICMKDDGNLVAGTIDNISPVRIVSRSGEENDFHIRFPNKKYPLDASACAYLGKSDKVVVIDRYEHTVYIYDIATNTKVVVHDDQIKNPSSVAVGPSDCILVCSNGNNSIVQITFTGRILSSHVLDMEMPFSICASKDERRIAIANSSTVNRKLELFKHSH